MKKALTRKVHGYPVWHYFVPWESHQFSGYVTPWVGYLVGWPLAALMFAAFYLYEILEWLHFWWIDKHPDKVYSDVLEYNMPLFAMSMVLLALGALGIV